VGISWSHRYSYCQSQTPSPSQQQSLGYYTTSCVAPLPHLFLFATAQVSLQLFSLHLESRCLLSQADLSDWVSCMHIACSVLRVCRLVILESALGSHTISQHVPSHFIKVSTMTLQRV